MEGNIISNLNYRFKYTFSKNYGTYGEKYTYRYSWIEEEDYYYENGKNQNYSQLQLIYNPGKIKNLSINTNFAYDFGELYHSIGLNLGLRYIIKSNK